MEEKKGDDMQGRRFHWAWIILSLCFVDLFVSYSIRLGYGVVLPEMIRDLGLSRTAAGSIFNAYLLCYVALTPFTGYLTDRFGARRVISICAVFLGAGSLWMGTADSLWNACLFYGICGIGATGMWTPVLAVVQRWFALRRRGLALGIASTGYGLGFAAMGVVFPWIVQNFNWRYSWYFLGSAALAMVFINALLLRSDPEHVGLKPWGLENGSPPAARPAVPALPKQALSSVFREKTFWLIGASYFCISYALYGITTFMVDYARDEAGMPLEKASLLATIHGFCQIAGVLTILPLSDRLGRGRTIFLSNLFITGSVAGILFLGGTGWMLYPLIGILAVFYGVTFPMYGACAGDYFPKEVMATVIGAWTPFYGLGAVSVHWVSGILRDWTGTYRQAFLLDALMAAAGVALISTVSNSSTKDTKGHEE